MLHIMVFYGILNLSFFLPSCEEKQCSVVSGISSNISTIKTRIEAVMCQLPECMHDFLAFRFYTDSLEGHQISQMVKSAQYKLL